MKLSKINQANSWPAVKSYDCIITVSGYESRASHVARVLEREQFVFGRKVVFEFMEHSEDLSRVENDRFFSSNGYSGVLFSGSDTESVYHEVTRILLKLSENASATLLVDYTSMTRAWIGGIVKALNGFTGSNTFTVDFTYSPGEFAEPFGVYPPNRVVEPVSGFAGSEFPDKPTALIIGLGYDRDRALGLKYYLDAPLTLAFKSGPSTDDRFTERVGEKNRELLEELGSDKVFDYPVSDFVTTFRLLESVCNGLCRDWRVVLCSLGPKPFGLACFLVASFRHEISIWRVGADKHEVPFDHKPLGPVFIAQTEWL